jgi:protein-S-isoprenylcysteine O-methyltransferase Ste14
MYAGALLMFVGTPLLLGSWWGLLFVPLGALGIGIRAVAEERMLRRELAGYEEYSATSGSGWFPASGDNSLSRQEQSAPHPKRRIRRMV